jgi:catechol 2,3-dioxygenase-like lactoylglutathione lyase family enzyme
MLPRFRDLGDREILESDLKLADAQQLVARLEGFDDWQSLLNGANTMSDIPERAPSPPVFTSIEPQLYVANVQRSCDFYTERLGFAIEFVYGEPPFYGQVSRNHARLNLRLVSGPVFLKGVRKREGLLSASITVASASEIKQLFLDYQAAEVPFYQTPKREPWGSETFIVSDPDDNLVLFAGPADCTSNRELVTGGGYGTALTGPATRRARSSGGHAPGLRGIPLISAGALRRISWSPPEKNILRSFQST